MKIEKWRYTKRELSNMVNTAYENCPICNVEDLKLNDFVLDDNRKTLQVSRRTRSGKVTFIGGGNKKQHEYKLITEDLMQYEGVSHRTSIIEAVLSNKPVPDKVILEVKEDLGSRLNCLEDTVLGHFGQLTWGKPPLVLACDMYPNGRDYYQLLNHTNYNTWFCMLSERVQKIVINMNTEIKSLDQFFATIKD